MNVNMSSVLKKAQNYMNSEAGKKKNDQCMRQALFGDKTSVVGGRNIYSVYKIGDLFEQCLVNEISNANVLSNAVKEVLISSIDFFCSDYISYGSCLIDVYFNEVYAGARPSLYPDGYPEGINSLVALYNNGVDHVMLPVYGWRDGKKITSNIDIRSAEFVQKAKEDFKRNYSYDCNVIQIEISEDLERCCGRC